MGIPWRLGVRTPCTHCTAEGSGGVGSGGAAGGGGNRGRKAYVTTSNKSRYGFADKRQPHQAIQ